MRLQQRMMAMMLARKSPEDTRQMMAEMMPQMMAKIEPEGMADLMGKMMPRLMTTMGPEDMDRMMEDVMPSVMDSCFSEMDRERREHLLGHCRGVLDQMEEKYLKGATA